MSEGHEVNNLPVDHGNTRAGDKVIVWRRNNPNDPNDLTGQTGQAELAEADPVTLQGEIDALNARVASDEAALTALTARVAALEGGGGGPPTPGQETTYWIGLSADSSVTEDELTDSVTARNSHILTVPDIPTGQRRHIILARPASLGAFTFVYYYPPGHRDPANGIGGWMSVGNVTKNGVEQVVLITRALVNDGAGGDQVEAG